MRLFPPPENRPEQLHVVEQEYPREHGQYGNAIKRKENREG